MIHEIELTCFRQHQSLTVRLTEGLNVLRGPNESGKSTIIEAMMYAFSGAKVLRTPLSETVTRGHKESELKVRMVTGFGGVLQTWTRSKGGAECNWIGGRVTGQSEVAKYAADLLGADAKTASMLMLASQSDLRGSLDQGPTAVSGLMGKLADFDLIDRLLEAAQQTLSLGAEEPIRVKIAAAEAEIEEALASQPDPAEVSEANRRLAAANEALEAARAESDSRAAAAVEAELALTRARAQAAAHAAAEMAVARAQERLDSERSALDKAEVQARSRPAPEAIQAARDALAEASMQHERLTAYRKFKALPPYPEVHWEGTKEALQAELSEKREQQDLLYREVANLMRNVDVLYSRRMTSDKCPTCGSSLVDEEHVNHINAQLDPQIGAAEAAHAEAKGKLDEVMAEVTALQAVDRAAWDYERRWLSFAGYLTIDENFHPQKVEWKSEVPVEVSAEPARAEVMWLEAQERLALQAQGRAQTHRLAVAVLEADVQKAREALVNTPNVDVSAFLSDYQLATTLRGAASQAAFAANAVAVTCQSTVNELTKRQTEADAKRAAAEARIVEYRHDLEVLAFNNVLIKKLRGMKPLVTDHLWNKVLSAVSSFFSTMRGQPSVVTKEGDGFKVNGQAAQALSGSTLDVLALAIRAALTKTFIPHATFMCLDEPGQGCDTSRTGNLLGFLASVGMPQIIIASHDELSESVADNVVLLGQ